jgi:DNA polymerase-3 subunit epsilon
MRNAHNAVLDCTLLAQVYLELMGGKQLGLELATGAVMAAQLLAAETVAWTPRPVPVPPERAATHAAFVAGKVKDALWLMPPFAALAEG